MSNFIAIFIFLFLVTLNILYIFSDYRFDSVTSVVSIVIGVIGGLYFSDLFSGLLHYYFDHSKCRTNVLDEVLGKNIKAYTYFKGKVRLPFLEEFRIGFRLHHKYPDELGKVQTMETIIPAMKLLAIPVLLSNMLFITWGINILLAVLILTWAVTGPFSQYFHILVHRRNNGEIVKTLRKWNLILKRKEHATHHLYLDRNYCILNGWANPLLNKIVFFFRENFPR